MNLYQKLAIATVNAALSFTILKANSALAANLTYDFTVDLTSGSLTDQQYSGFVSYDDSTLTGTGLETLGVRQGMSISFNFLDETYDETSDLDFPSYPLLEFQDGSFSGLTFLALNESGFGFQFSTQNLSELGGDLFLYGKVPTVDGRGVTKYSLRSVPEPSLTLSSAFMGFGLLLKKKLASKKKK